MGGQKSKSKKKQETDAEDFLAVLSDRRQSKRLSLPKDDKITSAKSLKTADTRHSIPKRKSKTIRGKIDQYMTIKRKKRIWDQSLNEDVLREIKEGTTFERLSKAINFSRPKKNVVFKYVLVEKKIFTRNSVVEMPRCVS